MIVAVAALAFILPAVLYILVGDTSRHGWKWHRRMHDAMAQSNGFGVFSLDNYYPGAAQGSKVFFNAPFQSVLSDIKSHSNGIAYREGIWGRRPCPIYLIIKNIVPEAGIAFTVDQLDVANQLRVTEWLKDVLLPWTQAELDAAK